MRNKIMYVLVALLIVNSSFLTVFATTTIKPVNSANKPASTSVSTGASISKTQSTITPKVISKPMSTPAATTKPTTTTAITKVDTKIPVLMYHHISTEDPKGNTSVTSPDKFRSEMELLKKQGYTTIFFKDYINYKEKGVKLPDKAIIITFDDGYYSNYEYAYPILKELGMKATISIVGWSVGREYMPDNKTKIIKHFTWEQAREMYNSGVIDIQHHTYDLHSNVNGVKGVSQKPGESQTAYEKRFKEDTLKMKNLIESKVGNKVYVYCYPYGINNATTEKILKDMGFTVTLSVDKGVSDFSTGLTKVKRFNMSPLIASEKIFAEISTSKGRKISEILNPRNAGGFCCRRLGIFSITLV